MHQPNRPAIDETLTDFPRSLSGVNKSVSTITANQAWNVSKPPEGHA